MNKGIIKVLLGILVLSFIGIKYHPDFDEISFFIKYRPNFKFQYKSPLAESNLDLNDMLPSLQKEEIRYQEFVGDYLNSTFLDKMSPGIIALMSFLLISGVFSMVVSRKNRNRGSYKRMVTAYLSNVMVFFFVYSLYWNFKINGTWLIVLYFLLCTLFIILIYTRSFHKRYKKFTYKLTRSH